MFDVVIIGGGPAAISAGIYAARKRLNAIVITDNFGGQSIVSDSIENWIGETSISGYDLAKKLENHLRKQEDIEINTGELVEKVTENGNSFFVKTNKAKYETKTVLVASGARRKKMGVPGEDKFEGKGVVFCSTCDAPLFRGREVAVVGGGNAGLEAVVDLIPFATKIYLLNNTDTIKGDSQTLEEIKSKEKVEIINNATIKEIKGEALIDSLIYLDKNKEEQAIKVQGVFVEIGSVPNSEIVSNLVELNEYGEIVVDHKTYETSRRGVYAAGDVTDEIYKQNNISVGDAITAILSIYNYLFDLKKKSPAEN